MLPRSIRTLASRLLCGAALALVACSGADSATTDDDTSDVTSKTYELFFTNPLPDVIARGELQASDVGALATTKIAGGPAPDARLAALIDTAKGNGCSVLLSDFDFNLQNIADAMVRAKGRGCDVRMVTDGDTVDKANPSTVASERYGRMDFDPVYKGALGAIFAAGIPVHDDGARGAIMHDKFVVIDGQTVWTGSWNMSVGDLSYWNNAFVIKNADLAQRYTKEFEFLYSRFAAAHAPGNHVLNVPFTVPASHSLSLGGRPTEVYFPRYDKATARVAEVVGKATKSIHFLAFQFTDGPIADAVVERAGHGVEVRGVFENNGACSGVFAKISGAHGDVDVSRWMWGRIQGLRNFLHHKVFILDGETVVFGSFNFSQSADDANDENLLIVTDKALAKSFEDEYQLVEKATKLTPAPAACN